jgi:hypothetical protein
MHAIDNVDSTRTLPAVAQPKRAIASAATSPGAPPEPWFPVTHLRVASAVEGAHPAVITWSDDATYIYMDTDGDAGIEVGKETELAGLIASGELDVELVARLSGGKRLAWYAPSDSGFEVVTEAPPTPDGTLIRRMRRSDGSWSKQSVSGTWLSSSHLPKSWATPIVYRLHAFRKR